MIRVDMIIQLKINAQQRPVLEELLASGRYGSTFADVVRHGLVEHAHGIVPPTGTQG
jgi:hypothetical protein